MPGKFFCTFATLLLFLLTLACRTPFNPVEETAALPAPSPTLGAPTEAASVALPSPTALPPTATPTEPVQPTPTPTPTLRPPTPTAPAIPPISFDDLAVQRQAMRPEFAADVDSVAAAGASRYIIDVSLDLNEELPRLGGVEQIRYTNTENEPLDEIVFRLYPNLPGFGGDLTVDTVLIDGQPATPRPAANGTALRVPLPQPLEPGQQADLSLFFEATIPRQPRVGYNIFSFSNNTAALASFYPVVAVFDDLGWDLSIPPPYGDATYLDVSLYDVMVTAPADMVVVASGVQLEASTNADGSQTHRYVSGPMRDFYVVMRPDYGLVSGSVDGITVNSYFPPGQDAGGALALQYAIDSMRVFNERFGPYPYAEFDVVATPTTAGGVEYPGVIVAAEGLYESEGGFFQHVIGHEVAHQWWYGLVGNNQVLEPWLDEALTNYSTALYWEDVQGQASADHIIDTLFAGPYERARNSGNDRAVTGAVESFTQGQYGDIVYGKGPLFFHALRQQVGDDVYSEVMQSYLAGHKYQLATAADLLETIETVTGQSVEPLAETWLNAP